MPVSAVHGNAAVANTIPGRILPTGEPMPGKNAALPKPPGLPPKGVPICARNPGKPNWPPAGPGPVLKVPADPPINGNCTKG